MTPTTQTPITTIVRMQSAMIYPWLTACAQAATMVEETLAGPHEERREKRTHDVPPDGADLLEHYGRRCHDIDGERDL